MGDHWRIDVEISDLNVRERQLLAAVLDVAILALGPTIVKGGQRGQPLTADEEGKLYDAAVEFVGHHFPDLAMSIVPKDAPLPKSS